MAGARQETRAEPATADSEIVMRTVFPTKQLRDQAAEYHAIEDGRQALSNLAAYVTELTRNETTSIETTSIETTSNETTTKGAEN